MRLGFSLLISIALVACSNAKLSDQISLDTGRQISEDASFDVLVVEIPDVTIDFEEPHLCEGIANTDPEYCSCNIPCCQIQTWYCPPTGTEIQAKTAVLDICGDDLMPCDRNIDPSCPPAEIIDVTGCEHAFDCPPGINEDFTMYYDCEANGIPGQQEVRCDKGRLYYGECVTCVPTDEICDGLDNDCDEEIDEHQLNECGLCGPLPQDICDGLDNDCDGSLDEDLVRECITQCERGLEVCVEGSWIGCTAREPSGEQCDGMDNDCDSLVDEQIDCQCPPEIVGALLPCMEPPLSCGMGFKTCECDNEDCSVTKYSDCLALCNWLPPEIVPADDPQTCDRFVGIPVNPEVCNNFDEDCDGLTDESLNRICYSGPGETVDIGVCAAGSQVCREGQWFGEASSGDFVLDFCAGEVVPSREICDGADNDCDGTTDFGEVIPDTDILFILDWSGSMSYSINAVQMAMNRFANQFSAEEKLKWGLITGPRIFPALDQESIDAKEYLRLEADITSFYDFMSAFSSAGSFDAGASNEMLRDAVYLSLRTISGTLPYDLTSARWINRFSTITGSIPELKQFKVNWRDDADRIIIVFSDENDQSFLNPELESSDLLSALTGTPDVKLYVFTQSHYRRLWRRYTDPTGGEVFTLTSDSERMYNDLMSILDEICLATGSSAMCVPRIDLLDSRFVPASFDMSRRL